MAWARGDEEERPAFGLFTRGLLGAPTAPSWPALFESASGAAGEDRTALFTRVAQSLGEVLARQPTVAVLDDVQWADADSLALVRHLVLHVRSGPLLVLLTVRDGEDSRLLSPLLAALAREAALRLSLAPLGRSEVAELAARRGEGHSPEAIDVVFQRSGGNPFFAAELLRLEEPELLSGALPPNVQDVLRLRLARLGVEAVEALRALAVIGGAAELDLLAAAVGDAPAAVYERLDQAIEADLIQVRQDATLEFRHALLRDAVLAEVTSFQRHRWHLKVAEVSAALPGRRLAERAHHLVSAGPLAGAEEVIEAAIAAAGAAREQGAYLEARRWWEVADRRAAAGNVPVELRAAAAYGLGASQAALGDPGAGRLKLAEAVAWFLDLGDLAAVAATCRHWNAGDWTFLLSAPQDRRIMAPLERAAAATANEAVEVRAPVLFAETVARYDRLAPAELLARGRQLAGLAAAGRDAGRWAAETAANAVALLLSTGHEPHALKAHARLRDALEAWAEADGHTFSRARCAMDARASMLEFCQRLALGGGEACRAAFERALALASTVELDPATNVLAGYTMVTALSLAGDFAGAAAHLQEVAERHERSGIRGVRAYRASSQLQIAFTSGHLERAAGELAVLARSRNAHARAIAALIERQPERARAILADEPFGLGRRDWLMLLSLRAEVALAADASDDLVRLVPLLERWRDQTPALPMAQQCLAPIALTLGRARLALDQPAAAVDALEPAQRIASNCGSPVWEARAGWFLAAARHRSGAGDETDQQASAAQRTAARLGMRLEPGA
ncbi:MAG: AAA family ATPase [Acidimicrobiales bacterium]